MGLLATMVAVTILHAPRARAESRPASGAGLAAGVMDSGDDRYRPAAGVQINLGRSGFRYFQHGYREGDVSQFGGVASWSYRILPFGPKNWLRANMGLTALWETTHIREPGKPTRKETAYNGGIAFGAGLRPIDSFIYVELDWQHNLFAGGWEGISLGLGRRQFLGLTVGVEP